MSSPLAIAAVTAVLKDLLDNAMIDHSVSSAIGAPVVVTALAPDRIKLDTSERAQLNLFLYHLAPNAAYRNTDLPSRNERGERIRNPMLALDLWYMLTAYEQNDFDAEILLGYGMQRIHETPILTRDAIRRTLAAISPVTGTGILPAPFDTRPASDLADQFESVRITWQPLSVEEMSKLWSAFQINYRPSVAYQVTVVLIDSLLPARSPLPVLTRGEANLATGTDQGVVAQANLLSPLPLLQLAIPPNRQTVARMGDVLTLTGTQLDGVAVSARFTNTRTQRVLDLPAFTGGTASAFQVRVPQDPPSAPIPPTTSPLHPDNWQCGAYTVAAVVTRGGKTNVSNEIPIALAPRLTAPINVSIAASIITFTVQCSPKVLNTQRARLIVGTLELAADAIATPSTNTLTFQAPSSAASSGTYWARVSVDGVESILVDRSGSVPIFDPSQQVTIP